jgi:hypothetical protein
VGKREGRNHLEDLDVDGSTVSQDRQCRYKSNTETRSRNHCCRGKAILHIPSVYVCVALVIQHAKRMCRITLSSVAVRLYHIFPHYLTNDTPLGGGWGGGVLEHQMF